MVAAAVQWAERIMKKVEGECAANELPKVTGKLPARAGGENRLTPAIPLVWGV